MHVTEWCSARKHKKQRVRRTLLTGSSRTRAHWKSGRGDTVADLRGVYLYSVMLVGGLDGNHPYSASADVSPFSLISSNFRLGLICGP